MKTPRNVDGEDMAKHLVRRWSYLIVHQTGSHIVLRTQLPTGHTVAVPAHRPLKVGTLQSILRSVASHRSVEVAAILEGL
jgi:predicted RNA binding protein YcfA (HicA-like mRNA interferase family)